MNKMSLSAPKHWYSQACMLSLSWWKKPGRSTKASDRPKKQNTTQKFPLGLKK